MELLNIYSNSFAHGQSSKWAYEWATRQYAVRKYSWAVPTVSAIGILRRQPIVEIGAGTGYWASLIAKAGGDVVAYDRSPYRSEYSDGVHFHVRRGGTRWVANHPDRTLFICWPPYNTGMAKLALKTYRLAGGKKFIYIGEKKYGCCGNLDFFKELEKNWTKTQEVDIPQWEGIHDYLEVYIRR